MFEFHKMGVCSISSHPSNILVSDQPRCSNGSCGPFTVQFLDFSNACPVTYFDEKDGLHRTDSSVGQDVEDIDDMLVFMCSNSWQYWHKSMRRRWAFYTWMMKEHPRDSWFQEWWEPYLKDRQAIGDPILSIEYRRRRQLEEKILSIQRGEREGATGFERVMERRKHAKKLRKWMKSAATVRDEVRIRAFRKVVDGRRLEDLGEPHWKVHWIRRFLRGRNEIKERKRKKNQHEKASQRDPFVRIRELCPDLMSKAPRF